MSCCALKFELFSADMRDSKRNADDNEDHHGKRRYLEGGRDKIRERYNRDDRGDSRGSQNDRELSGFGRRPRGEDDYSDEEDSEGGRRSGSRRGGSRRSTGCKLFFLGAWRSS